MKRKTVNHLSSKIHDKSSKKKGYFGFIHNLKEELRQVSWTSRDELITLTKIVVGASFTLALGVYGVDLAIKGILNGLESVFHGIFG